MTDYFSDDFSTYDSSNWLTSTWASPGLRWLYTSWRANKVDHDAKAGTLTLNLTDQDDRGKAYTGSEVQTHKSFGFGIFEVRMQASGENGVNSNFFTYSGGVHGNAHNEIDFEFLGKDPTKVWTAYHSPVANGFGNNGPVGQRGQWVDLGFDASEGMHTYRIEWLPDSIRWYADGKLLREVVAPEGMTGRDIGIPEHPGKMYMNIWTGVPQWLGRTDSDFKETSAVYDSVTYMSWDHPDAQSYGDGVDLSAPVAPPPAAIVAPPPEEAPEPHQTPPPAAAEQPDPADPPSAPKAAPELPAPAPSGIVPSFGRSGTDGNDRLRGTNSEDEITGGPGADHIRGFSSKDLLAGGPGRDVVLGGAGDDTLVYVAEDNIGDYDVYVGQRGWDTLTLYLSEEFAARADVIEDIAAFQSLIASNSDTSTNGGKTFLFESLNLKVRAIEALDIVITGGADAGTALAESLTRQSVSNTLSASSQAEASEPNVPDAAFGPLQQVQPRAATAEVAEAASWSTGRSGAEPARWRSDKESYSREGNGETFMFITNNADAPEVIEGTDGYDVLSIYMSQAAHEGSPIDAEIAAFHAAKGNTHGGADNSSGAFVFDSLNLEVQSVEAVELVIYDSF